jgi:hypothetical protein
MKSAQWIKIAAFNTEYAPRTLGSAGSKKKNII